MTTITTDFDPALYVGTYAKYNNGSIAGAWLKLRDYDDADAFYAACAELHADEDDPEFMFQDFENVPDDLYSECGGVSELYELIEFIDQSYLDADVILAGRALDIPLDSIEDAYQGQYASDADFAEEMAEQLDLIPSDAGWPCRYIDWEWAARDLMQDYNEQDGHYFAANW